jgi:radical SAM protein with 4Fe4S-binding SPASM domain
MRERRNFDVTDVVKHLAVVTNRWGLSGDEVVRWHWEKAGTIEHAHDVMKNELGAGTMPSKLFGANAAGYRLCGLTYNVLTFLKRRALPERLRQARPERLRFEPFTMPLLAVNRVERLSHSFLDMCLRHSIPYSSQLITNGSLIGDVVSDGIATWGIDCVQITIDGPRSTHDARRPWRGKSRSSFDDIVRGLDKAVGRVMIRLRVNIDRNNVEEAMDILHFFEAQGWLTSESKFFVLHRCWVEALSARGVNVDEKYWREYDPFIYGECRDCQALPPCLGGCPRNRRDGAADLVRQACEYYRRFEYELLAEHIRLNHQRRPRAVGTKTAA